MRNLMFVLLLQSTFLIGQTARKVAPNIGYERVSVSKVENIILKIVLEKGTPYQIYVQQLGIDVVVTLMDATGKQLMEKDSPNGKNGMEVLAFTPSKTDSFSVVLTRLEEEGNPEVGLVSYYLKKQTKQDLALQEKAKQALLIENSKTVLTLDIDHFWEAYDHLSTCKTHWDSVLSFQNLYLDRATDGLLDFIEARRFSAEGFVSVIQQYPKYYKSVRPYTYEVKKSEPLIQEVFDKLQGIYANFKPFKVCFAIGVHRTGGTVSNRFVLIGTEMTTVGLKVDFSELGKDWMPSDTINEPNIPLRIKGIIAHECIHTQQKDMLDSNAIVCNQLQYCLREGSANFIAELVTGTTNYSATNDYGNQHENDLYQAFKSTLCYQDGSKWLYNGDTVKNQPADLGYYIGYKITQAYYANATDKQQAIIDIIDMDDPITFLQKSGYDKQVKH